MENSAIIVAVIAAVASIFGAIFTFFSNRFTSKTDKNSTILEQQYLKLISPLHQSLHIIDVKKMCDTIDNIVYENYYLLPDGLFDEYAKFRKRMLHSKHPYIIPIESDFGIRVSEFNRILRYKLGYSKIKVTKKEKKVEKLLANSSASSNKSKNMLSVFSLTQILTIPLALLTIFRLRFPETQFSFNYESFAINKSFLICLAIGFGVFSFALLLLRHNK